MLKALLKSKLEARAALVKAAIDAGRAMTPEEQKQYDDLGVEIKNLEVTIKAAEEQEKLNGTPVGPVIFAQPKDPNEKKWKGGIGEFMKAVAVASSPSGTMDNRLTFQNAASGVNETIPSEGGFVLEGEFVQELSDAMGTQVQVKNRIRMMPLTSAKKLSIWGPDESSRAKGSRWGGVQVYHASEADTVTATKPKFRKFEKELEKIMALCYITDEALEDASVLGNVIKLAYGDEMSFQVDDDIINGTGVGMALGVLNSSALVTVPKENNQGAGTIVVENINKMWGRLPARSKKNAVWYINQEVETALTELAFVVGTGGVIHPLSMEYLNKGTLKGAPVIPIEQAAGLGSKGDIILMDPTQYIGIDKNAPTAATSIHVRFLYDESLFRFTYRFNGAPYRSSPITPAKGTLQLSSFVTLAERA